MTVGDVEGSDSMVPVILCNSIDECLSLKCKVLEYRMFVREFFKKYPLRC